MTRLSEILDQMTTVLNDLKTVMDAEQQQLSAGYINGSQLQRITEEKALCWQPLIIWSSSAVWSMTPRAAPMMKLPSVGRPLPENTGPTRTQPAQRLAAGRADRAQSTSDSSAETAPGTGAVWRKRSNLCCAPRREKILYLMLA